jgi:hypothetical protein
MIKLNIARCEQLTILDGVAILIALYNTNLYNHILIPIFCEMITSTKFVRNELKKANALPMILSFIKNESNEEFLKDLINSLLIWLEFDKNYVESFLTQKENFEELFRCFEELLCDNLIDYLSVLLSFFKLSDSIQSKCFESDEIVKRIWSNLVSFDFLQTKDILLINVIMDFLDILVKNRKNDRRFLDEINFYKILENVKILMKEHKLIIVEEKVKKIYKKLSNLN